MANLYAGTYGAVIQITNLGDLSSASVLQMAVIKPDGTSATWPSAGNCDKAVSDTAIEYTLVEGDITNPGQYRIHPYIEISGGWHGHGDMVILTVHEVGTR